VRRQALNALAEGTAALRRLAQFLALDEAPAARPPMSEDKELPLLLAPGAVVKKQLVLIINGISYTIYHYILYNYMLAI
jgi:hypothetical protein